MSREDWRTFVNMPELSDDSQSPSQPNAKVKNFTKTQRNRINTVLSLNGGDFVYNMISANFNKRSLSLRCTHVKQGCNAKAKGEIVICNILG